MKVKNHFRTHSQPILFDVNRGINGNEIDFTSEEKAILKELIRHMPWMKNKITLLVEKIFIRGLSL